jgi:hypothetical protein
MILAAGAVQWGTVGEWLAAIATFAAVATVFLMRWLDQRKARMADEQAAASKVNTWYEFDPAMPEHWDIVVENAGRLPIYDFVACIWFVRAGPPLPGPHWETHEISSEAIGPLPPGAKRRYPLGEHWRAPDGAKVFPSSPSVEFRTAIVWQDPVTGKWWMRLCGKLHGPRSDKFAYPWTIRSGNEGVLPDLDALARRALDP